MKIQHATKDSWKTVDMSEACQQLDIENIFFTAEEYAQIQVGFIPGAMEDKWFIYFQEDTLYLHRSWTGQCIYRVHFVPHGSDYRINEAWVTTDATIRQDTPLDAEYEHHLLLALIDRILLDKPVQVPLPHTVDGAAVTSHLDKLMYLHGVIGNAQSNAERLRERQQREYDRTHLDQYPSEEEDILALFGLHELERMLGMATVMSDALQLERPPDVHRQYRALSQFLHKLDKWREHQTLTHAMLFRYMLVGLYRPLTGMNIPPGKTFLACLAEYWQHSAKRQRKCELFEQYYGKPLERFEEYHVLCGGHNFFLADGEELFRFVVEGA